MKKRILSLLLVFAMVFSLIPSTALAVADTQGASAEQANPFTDVKETDWFYDAVQYARVNGFFSGTSATTFEPNGTMTRGMFVTVLGRMAGVDADRYQGENSFSDVPADAYYAPYVAWAVKHGVTAGTGGGKFSPNALINREQMAVFFVRYFEKFDVDYTTDAVITTTPADIDTVSPYARDAVLKLWKTGLLNGDGVNFNPAGNASRAQAATLCMRTDETVETWYQEPGVPSERVSIDPEAGNALHRRRVFWRRRLLRRRDEPDHLLRSAICAGQRSDGHQPSQTPDRREGHPHQQPAHAGQGRGDLPGLVL